MLFDLAQLGRADERIQIFLERDFIDAEEQLGKRFPEIALRHILLHNAMNELIAYLTEKTVAVAGRNYVRRVPRRR